MIREKEKQMNREYARKIDEMKMIIKQKQEISKQQRRQFWIYLVLTICLTLLSTPLVLKLIVYAIHLVFHVSDYILYSLGLVK